jgi:cation/acetate symporter
MARLLPPERDIIVRRPPVRSSLVLSAAFLLLLLAFALLERLGFDGAFVPSAVVGGALVAQVLIAILAHGRRAADYYVADRNIGAVVGGLAGAGAFTGLLAIGLGGGGYPSGAAFFVTAVGLGLGFALFGFLIAPGLRRFAAYTTGDFLGARFGPSSRLASAVIAFIVSMLLLLAQLNVAAPLLATLLGLTLPQAFHAVAALTALTLLPGGMRSLTWAEAVLYFLVVLACLAPAAFLSVEGGAIDTKVAQEFGALLISNLVASSISAAAGSLLPVVVLAIGAATLPPLVQRGLTAPSGRDAAATMLWVVLFSLVVAMAGVVLVRLLAAVGGTEAASPGGLMQLAALFATLPTVLAALVVTGLLAALFAIGRAAMFSAATALSHDVWDETLDLTGAEGRRMVVARLAVVCVAIVAALFAPLVTIDSAMLMLWALSLSAAGLFVPLLLGLWWRRCNDIGVVAGMIAGFGFAFVVFLVQCGLLPGGATSAWAAAGPPSAAAVGLAVSLAITVAVSLLMPAAEEERREVKAVEADRAAMQERPA